MQKREKIFAIITISAGLFFVINQFVCAKKTGQQAAVVPKSAQKTVASATTGAQPIAGEKISDQALQKRLQKWEPLVTYETWGRDPFSGAMAFDAADTSANSDSLVLQLSGIVWKGDKALAIVGDQILGRGERSNDFEVLEILADRVVGRRAGKLVTLYLRQEDPNVQILPHN